jgi:hypothetical protein
MTDEHEYQLASRTNEVIRQLQRYGTALEDELLVATLEALTDINDDLSHGREPLATEKRIDMAIAYLQTLKDRLK